MSRLIDQMKAAERKRRESQAPGAAGAAPAYGATEPGRRGQASGGVDPETDVESVRVRRSAVAEAKLAAGREVETRARGAAEAEADAIAERRADEERAASAQARARETAERAARELAQRRTERERELRLLAEAREAAELAANQAAAARADSEAQALAAAGAALAAAERERDLAVKRALNEKRAEDSARARLGSETALAEAENAKLHAESMAHHSATERARIEAQTAAVAKWRNEDSARRAALAGERKRLGLARLGAQLRRVSMRSALAALSFALGFGASALWFEPDAQNGKPVPGGQAATVRPPESPAARPAAAVALGLRMDADHAAFAARAASKTRNSR